MTTGGFSIGSNNQFRNSAVGDGASVTFSSLEREVEEHRAAGLAEDAWQVGLVTILSEEMRAVIEKLGLHRGEKIDGLHFYTGEVAIPGRRVRVVATRTHSQGQRSVMASLGHLRRHFSPRLWVLVGVGGGIHDEYARIGNVIVSTRVVYYEQRKINPLGNVQRRGEEREAPARVVHAVNTYFTEHGDPARIKGQLAGRESHAYQVFPGLIGSGEAVIADRDSGIRRYLSHYNDKVLAVDMESGGLSQFWQESSANDASEFGWLVVRGVSDNADQEKGHEHHELAAHNAAFVVRELLPYLC
ncbi:5'-methylthioadenosine/S-adenosylhomocysteine nucleosidase family protein [Streptomyces marincola]|uniref:5'-methylthioadenosine/S-adenosylhomocysteine nucleosidase family protein n=1 Tax=Streptomyces marincola TaxID=2878388 RepID=UPI001CF2D7E2|nr:5'-methylthioadenosine/S-adenosylhomocysteine nucleosidase [Streptomyces marincola]UCM91269.1 5'-methylthioadenosine/S-adenosylhomocysteine nucleosidase [Streptomyces marincola]